MPAGCDDEPLSDVNRIKLRLRQRHPVSIGDGTDLKDGRCHAPQHLRGFLQQCLGVLCLVNECRKHRAVPAWHRARLSSWHAGLPIERLFIWRLRIGVISLDGQRPCIDQRVTPRFSVFSPDLDDQFLPARHGGPRQCLRSASLFSR